VDHTTAFRTPGENAAEARVAAWLLARPRNTKMGLAEDQPWSGRR
jgi:hypothetical protein